MKKRRPDIKTRALREQLAAEKHRAACAEGRAYNAVHNLSAERTHRACVEADLAEVTRRLRAICQHTYALEAKGKALLRDRRAPAPVDPRAYTRVEESVTFFGTEIRHLDLAQLLFWAESNTVDFGRYMYLEIVDFKRGQIHRAGYAVSDHVLEMMRDGGVEHMARDIGEQFAGHIHKALTTHRG